MENYKIIRKLKLLATISWILNTVILIANFGWLLVDTANNGISFRAILIFMVIATITNAIHNFIVAFVAEKNKKQKTYSGSGLFDKLQEAVEAVVEEYTKLHPNTTEEHLVEHINSFVEIFVSSKLSEMEKEENNNG